MNEHEHPTGRVKPSPSQPKMANLGETLPEFVSHAEMKAQALGPVSLMARHPTQAGLPGGPTAPIAAAPRQPTPSPRPMIKE
jgi:hypothetical protein